MSEKICPVVKSRLTGNGWVVEEWYVLYRSQGVHEQALVGYYFSEEAAHKAAVLEGQTDIVFQIKPVWVLRNQTNNFGFVFLSREPTWLNVQSA